MKKSVTAVILIIFTLGFVIKPEKALADSPLTSTPFSTAYEDIDLVTQASSSGVMDLAMANYLADENNPIDVKAAIINALSWEDPGRNNAEKYCEFIYKDSLKNLDVSSLSGDQEFCIGYLIAMDDYVNISPDALKYLKEAEQKISDSFTVSVIRAIIESMDDFDGAWDQQVQPILKNVNIQMDMRQAAVNIIIDYMSLYHKTNGIIVSDNSLSIKNGTSTEVYLFGRWMSSYGITEGSDLVSAEILQDEYGLTYLKLTGIKDGSSFIKVKNDQDENAVITFAVNSEGTNYIPSVPQTGEESRSLLWIMGMAATAAGIFVSGITLIIKRRLSTRDYMRKKRFPINNA